MRIFRGMAYRIIHVSIILLLLIFSSAYAQIGTNNQRVKDSINTVIVHDSTFTVDEKIDLLTTLSETFAKSNPVKADTYLETALTLAQTKKDTNSIIKLSLGLAKNKNKQCFYQTADDHLQYVLSLSDNLDGKSIARVTFLIAQNYYDWSRYNLAKLNYEKVLNLSKSQKNRVLTAKSYTGLGAIASNFSEYEQAIEFMENAREIYLSEGDQSNLARTLMGLGVILEKWDKTTLALSYYNTAIETFRELDDTFQEVNLMLHIGDIYLSQNLYDSCLILYNNALKLEEKVNNLKLRSICYSNIGEAYYEMGEYNQAENYQLVALDLKNKVGDRKRIAISLLSLGKINRAVENYELAEKHLKDCIELSKSINNKQTELESLLYLSKVYEEKKDFKQALIYLNNYNLLKDTIFDHNSKQMLHDMEVKYHAKSIEKENEILRQKDSINTLNLQNQKDSFYIAILVIVFIMVIFIIMIIFINLKNKQTKKNYTILAKKNKEITSQKEKLSDLNKELVYSREQYRSIVENATIGMYQTTRDGRIKYANTGLVKMLGYSSLDELKFVNLNKQKINRERFIELIEEQHIISGREDAWKRKDGSKMYVFESAWVVKDRDNQILHYEGIVEDITKRKETEIALRDSQNKLEEMNIILTEQNKELEILSNEAIEANEIKGQFIANVSHEIRTPLNSIIGFSELLSSSIKNKEQLNYINSIKSSSKNLLNLINNILDLSKVQSSDIELIFHPVSIYNLMQDIEQVFKLRFIEKGLVFSIIIDKTVPETLLMDEVRFRQIMVNLISNSIKYTNDGSISVNIVGTPKENIIDLEIDVIDTGIGIKEEELESIFDAFNQGEKAKKNHLEGTGLGLSISKQLVQKMGGTIVVTSELNKGSKFKVLLPGIETVPSNTFKYESENKKTLNKVNYDNPIEKPLLSELISEKNESKPDDFAGKFSKRWKELSESGIVKHLEVFCYEAIQYAKKNNNAALEEYFNNLLFYANQFDVEMIEEFTKSLNHFFEQQSKN